MIQVQIFTFTGGLAKATLTLDLWVLLTALLIMLSRICDVTLATVRTIMVTKGMSFKAALIGFFEILIYVAVLNQVMKQLNDSPIYLLAYGLGFALGNYLGTKVEGRLAFGDVVVRIIIGQDQEPIIETLRSLGYGVTVFEGHGRTAPRLMLVMTMKRKRVKPVLKILDREGISSHVMVHDISSYHGGYVMERTDKK